MPEAIERRQKGSRNPDPPPDALSRSVSLQTGGVNKPRPQFRRLGRSPRQAREPKHRLQHGVEPGGNRVSQPELSRTACWRSVLAIALML